MTGRRDFMRRGERRIYMKLPEFKTAEANQRRRALPFLYSFAS